MYKEQVSWSRGCHLFKIGHLEWEKIPMGKTVISKMLQHCTVKVISLISDDSNDIIIFSMFCMPRCKIVCVKFMLK